MIFTKFGVPVNIVENNGLHRSHIGLIRLVTVESVDDPEWRHVYPAAVLKADGGWKEVEDAFLAAPDVMLEVAQVQLGLAKL